MPRTIVVSVTKEDIKNGLAECADACPVALAAQRRTGRTAVVGSNHIRFYKDDYGRLVASRKLPKEATEFVDRYDARKPVKPFRFKLTLPEGV